MKKTLTKSILSISAIIVFTFAMVSCCDCPETDSDGKTNTETISLIDSLSKVEITADRMTPELLWKFGRIWDAQLSPDGKTVIYNVQRYNATTNKGYIDIFSVPAEGGDAVQLTNFVGVELNHRWSVDILRITYQLQPGAYIWDLFSHDLSSYLIRHV